MYIGNLLNRKQRQTQNLKFYVHIFEADCVAKLSRQLETQSCLPSTYTMWNIDFWTAKECVHYVDLAQVSTLYPESSRWLQQISRSLYCFVVIRTLQCSLKYMPTAEYSMTDAKEYAFETYSALINYGKAAASIKVRVPSTKYMRNRSNVGGSKHACKFTCYRLSVAVGGMNKYIKLNTAPLWLPSRESLKHGFTRSVTLFTSHVLFSSHKRN